MDEMSREWLVRGMAVMAALASAASGAQAQNNWESPDAFVDLTFFGVEPVGEFARNVDGGWGLGIGGRFPMDSRGILSMRADAGFINYGHERFRQCSVTCRVGLDVETNNNILFLGVGPELAAPLGPIRPYVGVEGGLGYFVTSSSIGGDRNYNSFASSTNFDDAVFQWRGRGGIQFRLSGGRTPVFLDLGGEYHRNGIAEYLREGDIVDEPDGSVTLFTTRSEANLWTFRLGVSIGVGGGGDGDDDRPRRRGRRGRHH
jgi:opacity protein-like surface antigen